MARIWNTWKTSRHNSKMTYKFVKSPFNMVNIVRTEINRQCNRNFILFKTRLNKVWWSTAYTISVILRMLWRWSDLPIRIYRLNLILSWSNAIVWFNSVKMKRLTSKKKKTILSLEPPCTSGFHNTTNEVKPPGSLRTFSLFNARFRWTQTRSIWIISASGVKLIACEQFNEQRTLLAKSTVYVRSMAGGVSFCFRRTW